MPLLGLYTYTGNVTMVNGPATAAGAFCLAHGLPTTPDVALAIPSGPQVLVSLPIGLVSRTATTVIFNTNASTVGLSTEVFVQYVHTILR